MPIGINQGYQITMSNALGEALPVDFIVRGISLQKDIKLVSLEVRGHPGLDRLVLTARTRGTGLGDGISVKVSDGDTDRTDEVELCVAMPVHYRILRRDYPPKQ